MLYLYRLVLQILAGREAVSGKAGESVQRERPAARVLPPRSYVTQPP